MIWLALVATASAEPRTDAALVWQAPAACPDAAEVRARIERRLGVPIDRAVHGITVDIAPDATSGGAGRASRFVARIDLRGVPGANEVRVLTSARCDELTDAVAVVIARIAADSRASAAGERGAGDRGAGDHGAGDRGAGDRGAEARGVRGAAGLAAAAPRVWGGGIQTLGVSGIGAQPRVGLGGSLSAYVRHGSAFAELAEARWLPSTRFLHPGAPGRVDIRLAATGLRVGWGPEAVPLRVWIAGELGSVEGEGVALVDGHVGAEMWAGAGAGVGVAWPMARLVRLVGVVEAVVPFQRPRLTLQDGTEVYRTELATARCGLGLEVGWR
jgi:hypothetical protein